MKRQILVISAGPRNRARLRTDEEFRVIREALQRARERDQFSLDFRAASRIKDVRRALLEVQPEIVHFAGHGDRTAAIILEDNDGLAKPVDATLIAGMLSAAERLECVFLNACLSANIAQNICELGINCIGSERAITDRGAIAFSEAFYDALFSGTSYQAAFAIAETALRAEDKRANVLFLPGRTRAALIIPDQQWADAPRLGPLVGRTRELDLLYQWIIKDRARLIGICGVAGIGKTRMASLLGPGGIGKTDLSIASAKDVAHDFSRLVWRRVLNAPSLPELARQLTGIDGGLLRDESAEEAIQGILSFLRKERSLVILDNFESVLSSDTSKEYLDLIQRIGDYDHPSCVVLTSRETPSIIGQRAGESSPVRLLELKGLDADEARRLIELGGGKFEADSDSWSTLHEVYGGNPLAIELAGKHIQEVFFGDIAEFLRNGRYAFSDISSLLDWHIQRLTDQEFSVLQWLALHREPTPLTLIQSSLHSRRDAHDVAGTLQSLARKMPLERAGRGWTLQPVLIEHLSDIHWRRIAAAVDAVELDGYLSQFPALLATSPLSARSAHQVVIVDAVLAALGESSRTSPREALVRCLEAAQRRRLTGYSLGTLFNLASRQQISLRDFRCSGELIEADLSIGDCTGLDLSGLTISRCTFVESFGSVLCAAVDSADERVWVAGTEGELRCWQLATGDLLHAALVSEKWVRSAALSRSESLLATAGDDNLVRLWDANDCRLLRILRGAKNWVMSVGFSPNEQILVSAGEDKCICAWSTTTGELIVRKKVCEARIQTIRFLSHERLMCGSADGTIVLLDWPNLRVIAEVRSRSGGIRQSAYLTGSGSVVVSHDNGSLSAYSSEDLRELWCTQAHEARVRALDAADDGELIVTGADDGSVAEWDSGGNLVRSFPGHNGRVYAVAMCHRSPEAVSAGDDQAVRAWDLKTGALRRALHGYSNPVWGLEWSESFGLSVATEDGKVRSWWSPYDKANYVTDVYPGRRVRTVASIEADSSYLVYGGDAGRIVMRSSEANSVAKTIDAHSGRVTQLVATRAGGFASAGGDGLVCMWDARGSRLAELDCAGVGQNALAYSATGGGRIFAGGDDGLLRAWSVGTNALLASFEVPERIWSVSVSADGELVALGAGDGCVYILDSGLPPEARVFEGHEGWVWCVRFVGNGTVFSSGEDGCLRRWRLADNQHDLLQAHSQRVRAVVRSPDGTTVAAGSDDGGVSIVSVSSMERLATVRLPRPYEGTIIGGSSGLSPARLASLETLGARTI